MRGPEPALPLDPICPLQAWGWSQLCTTLFWAPIHLLPASPWVVFYFYPHQAAQTKKEESSWQGRPLPYNQLPILPPTGGALPRVTSLGGAEPALSHWSSTLWSTSMPPGGSMVPGTRGPAIVQGSITTTPWPSFKDCPHWYCQGHFRCLSCAHHLPCETWGVSGL